MQVATKNNRQQMPPSTTTSTTASSSSTSPSSPPQRQEQQRQQQFEVNKSNKNSRLDHSLLGQALEKVEKEQQQPQQQPQQLDEHEVTGQPNTLLEEEEEAHLHDSLKFDSDYLSVTSLLTPRHSDYTIPTSNVLKGQETPPQEITPAFTTRYYHPHFNMVRQHHNQLYQPVSQKHHHHHHHYRHQSQQDQQQQQQQPRRAVLGNRVNNKYARYAPTMNGGYTHGRTDLKVNTANDPSGRPSTPTHTNTSSLHRESPTTPPRSITGNAKFKLAVSPISPYGHYGSTSSKYNSSFNVSGGGNGDDDDDNEDAEGDLFAVHETIHAQSLLLGCAFLAVWSANNIMAPNLTQIAESFGMGETERDLYLGSYCALAVGVFSLPISAIFGILADFYSRKHLFVATVAGGAVASLCTGLSTSFTWLFLARLVNGGCMSGSVPVAFSLLGDLFATEERNAASSGLTAMMGLGIVLGQVYAGMVGDTEGWQHAFFVSSIVTLISAFFVLWLVREPIRGGKEKVLQDMIKSGTKYDRKLTLDGFIHALRHNESNRLLMWQGFFSSLPWGIIFVFLNDFLSQEKGFSVPDATFMVMLFGIGCAIGGVLGGYWGQMLQDLNRTYLPLFMAATTFLGIAPFIGLLNTNFKNPHGFLAMFYATMGGIIASLPSVNVRPCLINVNPPETRGATLTAANLIINLARGVGPSCITLMGTIWNINRQGAFNITLFLFWTISAIQLFYLSRSLPKDQDAMEGELAKYAEAALAMKNTGLDPTTAPTTPHQEDESYVSIEDLMTSFDGIAARQSLKFVSQGIRELSDEVRHISHFEPCHGISGCGSGASSPDILRSGSDLEVNEADGNQQQRQQQQQLSSEDMERRRQAWLRQQALYDTDHVNRLNDIAAAEASGTEVGGTTNNDDDNIINNNNTTSEETHLLT